MKKLNLLIVLFLSFSSIVLSQKDSIQVEKAPLNLPIVDGDWQESAKYGLNSESLIYFFNDPNYYTGDISSDFSIYKEPINKILTSETLANTLYDWLIAPVKILWKRLNYTTKANLHDIIVHCSLYANTFSLVNEDNYLKMTKKMVSHEFGESHIQFHRSIGGESYFNRWDPKTDFFDKDFKKPIPEFCHSKYRKLDALIYRRVKDGASIKIIQNVLKKLLIDLPFNATGSFEDKTENSVTKTSFKNGKRDGVWIREENTVVVDSGLYVNDVKEGVWKSYDASDKIHLPFSVESYKNGKLIERTFTQWYDGKVYYRIWFSMSLRKYIISHVNSSTNNLDVIYQGKFY